MRKAGMIIGTICLMLAMSMAVPASEEMQSYPEVGVDLPIVEELEETTGTLFCYPLGIVDNGHHLYVMGFLYDAMPIEEAMNIINNPEASEEEINKLVEAQTVMGMLLASDIDSEKTRELYDSLMGNRSPVKHDETVQVGSADGFTFYYVPGVIDEEYLSSIDKVYTEELEKLGTTLQEVLKTAEYYEPSDLAKRLVGKKLEFTTKDLDGNTVTSADLFSKNEMTMVNCWGIWCDKCVDEMPKLAELHTKMQEKGCGIVGVEFEGIQEEKTYQKARELMKEWGTNYPNVLIPDEIRSNVSAFPTTFFVDKEGNVLDMPIVGAKVETFESKWKELLEGGTAEPEKAEPEKAESETAAPAKDETEEVGERVYTVIVTDDEGPVAEALVQFCDEASCRVGETDEDGAATFTVPGGKVYEVHVVEVPEGYEEDETVYYTKDGSNEVNIKIRKKK